jgi:PTH2 family peptidyl-tRNA hydrolase
MPVEPNQHDNEALAAIRRDQEDPIILYVIVRKSLNMGVGKIAAQVHHAAKIFLLRHNAIRNDFSALPPAEMEIYEPLLNITEKWIDTSFRTVLLVANDKDWEKLKDQLRVFIVRDAGLTEVEAGSETVMSTWPMKKSERPKLLRRLQVLQ